MKFLTFGEIMLRLKSPRPGALFPERPCWRPPSAAARPTWLCLWPTTAWMPHIVTVPARECHWPTSCIEDSLRKFGVDTSQHRPFRQGDRVGIYYLENGANARPSKVCLRPCVLRHRRRQSPATSTGTRPLKVWTGSTFTGITPAISESAMELQHGVRQGSQEETASPSPAT